MFGLALNPPPFARRIECKRVTSRRREELLRQFRARGNSTDPICLTEVRSGTHRAGRLRGSTIEEAGGFQVGVRHVPLLVKGPAAVLHTFFILSTSLAASPSPTVTIFRASLLQPTSTEPETTPSPAQSASAAIFEEKKRRFDCWVRPVQPHQPH